MSTSVPQRSRPSRPTGRPSPIRVGKRRDGFGYTRQALLTSAPLALADLAAFFAAVAVGAGAMNLVVAGPLLPWFELTAWLVGPLVLANLCFGLYPGVALAPYSELRQASLATSLVFCVALATVAISKPGVPVIGMLLAAWPICLVLIPWGRSLVRTLVSQCRWWGHPALILGAGDDALARYSAMAANCRRGLRPVGVLDYAQNCLERNDGGPLVLGTHAEAGAIADAKRAYWAVVALPGSSRSEVLQVVNEYAATIPHLLVLDDTAVSSDLWPTAHECGGTTCVKLTRRLLLPWPAAIKRFLDLLLAVGGGLCVLPLVALIAVLIKLDSRGPIFFQQERLGRGGRRFHIWKFRTMVVDADQVLTGFLTEHPNLLEEWNRDHKLKNDCRITRIGAVLRRTSLDELPQFWNVINGEMSLVGPRPIVQAEIAKYKETYRQYLRVNPGLSGLWQVSGRNNTTYAERLGYDEYYVENWSPWLDLYILARSLRVILLGEGAY